MQDKSDLFKRKVNTKAANRPVIQFDLQQIKSHFDDSMTAIEKQFAFFDELESKGKDEESKNILRSQVVLAQGVLDFYIHEISKYGLFRMFKNEWEHSIQYGKIEVPMEQVEIAINTIDSKDWFFDFLNKKFCREVYLSAESMRKQLNLCGIPFSEVMHEVLKLDTINLSDKKGKEMVEDLFRRRNEIVHQNDRDHSTAKQNNITKDYTTQYLEKIKKISEAIAKIAIDKA